MAKPQRVQDASDTKPGNDGGEAADVSGELPDDVLAESLTYSNSDPPTAPYPDNVKAASKKISDQPIGRILVEAGRLSATDAQRVAQVAAEFKMRFGDAAVEMDLVKRSDVAFALGRQFSFPRLERNDPSLSPDLIAAYQPDHPVVERLRELRAQIAAHSVTAPRLHPMVAIVSPDRSDGRSFVAANLAVVFAQLGVRTLVIDADMRNPSQHRYFRCDNRVGLSSLLAGRCGVECLHRVSAFPGIFVLTAGPTPPNPLELLERPVFGQLLASADTNFRAVIIDTPAGMLAADARRVSGRSGANVLIARSGHTRAPKWRALHPVAGADKSNVLGVVLNEH